MTARSKSILMLATTLVIGMVLGALLFGTVQRQRFGDALRLVRPDRFVASVEQVIQPVDERQRQAVRRALEGFDDQMQRSRGEMAQRMRAELDSLQSRLSPLLDEAQRARLREHLTRHRGAIRRPPPGAPPPPWRR